jgi:hypothetical protein
MHPRAAAASATMNASGAASEATRPVVSDGRAGGARHHHEPPHFLGPPIVGHADGPRPAVAPPVAQHLVPSRRH